MWVRCETFKQLSYVVYQLTLVVRLRRGIFEMILHPTPRFPSLPPAWVGDKRTGLEEEEETKLGVGGSEFAIHRKGGDSPSRAGLGETE